LNDCDRHRPHLAAIADGKASLVPVATFEHVAGCSRCTAQLELHWLLTDRRREEAGTPARAPSYRQVKLRRPLPVGALAMAGTAVLLVGGLIAGTVTWQTFNREDPVATAVSVAAQPPQFRSGDSAQIEAWCVRETGHTMQDVPLPTLHPVGARVDRRRGQAVVTLSYHTDVGQPVQVSWLDGQPAPHGANTESRSIQGKSALVVPGSMGSVVVTGVAPASVLWSVAGTIKSEEDQGGESPMK
jgi:hypothetical protein